MKKCPYCAEEIQEGAIKCKHCGEWLSKPIEKFTADASDVSQDEQNKGKVDSVSDKKLTGAARKLKTETRENTDGIELQQATASMNIANKPSRYGWGWLILLGWYAYDAKRPSFSYEILNVVKDTLFFPFLILYFVLRNKFIKKWEFNRNKPGFVAGLCIFLLSFIVSGVMLYFDTNSINEKLESIGAKYEAQVEFYKQEDNRYESKFIAEPKTVTDIKANIKATDEVLAYNEKRKRFFHGILNDWKTTLEGYTNTKLKKSWSEVIDQMLLLSDKKHDKEKRAYELLKEYYITGNEEYYQEYIATSQEAEGLKKDYQQLRTTIF